MMLVLYNVEIYFNQEMYDFIIGLNKLVDFFLEDIWELLSKDNFFYYNGGCLMMYLVEEYRK